MRRSPLVCAGPSHWGKGKREGEGLRESTWATPTLKAVATSLPRATATAGGSERTVPWDVGMPGGRERHLLPQAPWQHFWWRGHCQLLSHLFGGLGMAQVTRMRGQDQAVPAR